MGPFDPRLLLADEVGAEGGQGEVNLGVVGKTQLAAVGVEAEPPAVLACCGMPTLRACFATEGGEA